MHKCRIYFSEETANDKLNEVPQRMYTMTFKGNDPAQRLPDLYRFDSVRCKR